MRNLRHWTLIVLMVLSTGAWAASWQTASGTAVTDKETTGRWVVINFWAEWCESCIAEIPAFNKLHQEFKKDKKAIVLSMHVDTQDPAVIQKAVKSLKVAYPVLIEDPSDYFGIARHPILPATFIISPKGEVKATWYGDQNVNALPGKVKKVIEGG